MMNKEVIYVRGMKKYLITERDDQGKVSKIIIMDKDEYENPTKYTNR